MAKEFLTAVEGEVRSAFADGDTEGAARALLHAYTESGPAYAPALGRIAREGLEIEPEE
jgi:hypothetical protein